MRDGFYADELRVYYASRGRVYVVRSPRMRSGQGYRRIALLPADAQALDESAFEMPAEQVYHAFVLGLLVHLQPQYLVRSNRESGQGRFDVMIVPRGADRPGVVLELKVKRKGETLKQALAKALKQIETQDYAAELRAVGARPIHRMAFAFDGKKVVAGSLPEGAAQGARRK